LCNVCTRARQEHVYDTIMFGSFDNQSYWHSLQAIFQVAFGSLVKQLFVQKLSYENVFHLQIRYFSSKLNLDSFWNRGHFSERTTRPALFRSALLVDYYFSIPPSDSRFGKTKLNSLNCTTDKAIKLCRYSSTKNKCFFSIQLLTVSCNFVIIRVIPSLLWSMRLWQGGSKQFPVLSKT